MQPKAGLLKGGTAVSIVGAWFKYMPEYGVVPHCKFGDKIVRANFDSTVRIVCYAPPATDLGVYYPVSVSLNGVDWIDTGF
jgi:enterochelin esterase-like enzyme